MAGNLHDHGNLGELELFSIFLNFHYTLLSKPPFNEKSMSLVLSQQQIVLQLELSVEKFMSVDRKDFTLFQSQLPVLQDV